MKQETFDHLNEQIMLIRLDFGCDGGTEPEKVIKGIKDNNKMFRSILLPRYEVGDSWYT